MMLRPLLLLALFVLFVLASGQVNIEDDDNNDVEEPQGPKSAAGDESEEGTDGPRDYSNGFGTDIDWVGFDQAVSIALDLNRPIFLLIHKTWCGACQALKKSLDTTTKRKELVELSRKFVMVNTEDDQEPEDDEFAPDGRYIPRLFILNKHGKRLPVDNAKNYPSNIAYFPQAVDVIKAMKKGLELFEKEGESTDQGETAEKKEKKEKSGEKEEKKKADKKKGDEAAEKQKKEEQKKTEKKEKKSAESTPKAQKEEAEKGEDEAAAGKGGCPHAAGKAAAKKKKEEEEKKKTAEKTESGKKKADDKKSTQNKEGEAKKKGGESGKKKEGAADKTKKTDERKAEQQKKGKKTEKKQEL